MTRYLASLFLLCGFCAQAQFPVPPVQHRSVVFRRPITNTLAFSFTSISPCQFWWTTNEGNFYPEDTGITSSNCVTLTFNHRRRVWFSIGAININGVVCGDLMEAHWPRYPDVFDHLLLTLSGGNPPFTIEASDDLKTWNFLTVLESNSFAIRNSQFAILNFLRASAEEETELQLTTVWKPDPRESPQP